MPTLNRLPRRARLTQQKTATGAAKQTRRREYNRMNSNKPTRKCQQTHRPEIEDAVIGALLLVPWRFAEAAHLSPSDFASEGYQRVFAAMKNLHARGIVPDAPMICDELRRTGKYSAEHGATAGHLLECFKLAPSGFLLRQYIAAIKPKPASIDIAGKLARERRRAPR